MRNGFRWWVGFLLALFGLLASAPVGAQEAGSLVRVHIPGYSPNSIPFQIAEEVGAYRTEGVRVHILRMKTGAGIQALLAGDVDASQIVGPTTLAAIVRGAPLKIVMIFNDKPLYWLYAKKGIRSFADLKGAKIGSSTPGSTSDRLLKIVLGKHHIQWKKDTTIIYVGTTTVELRALQSGALDAAVLNPPANFLAEESGFHPLASFENEVGALQGGVTVSKSFTSKKPETARRFLRATLRGLRYFKANRAGSVKIMAKFMSVAPEMAARIYDADIASFISSGVISKDFQDKVLDFELKAIGVDKQVPRGNVFDFSIVKSLNSQNSETR